MGPGPDQLPEVECRSSHEQIDGIAYRSFEVVLGHSVVMLDMAYHRFDSGPSSKPLTSFASLVGRIRLLGSTRKEDLGATNLLLTPVPTIADGKCRALSSDILHLLQNLRQGMTS
jgi:hypothetical protein